MAFTKFELLTSPSFEKIRILSILFLTTQRDPRKFPASTAVPVLAFPSSYLKVPNTCSATVLSHLPGYNLALSFLEFPTLASGRKFHWPPYYFNGIFFFFMILLRTSLQQNKVTYITNTTYKLITTILLTQAKLKKDNITNYYCY